MPTTKEAYSTPNVKEILSDTETAIRRMFDVKGAAKYAGCSESWLNQLRQRGSTPGCPAPAYIKLGRRILYCVTDIDAWLDAQRVSR